MKTEDLQEWRKTVKKCNWCNPNDEGTYNMAVFDNPEGRQRIVMAFTGAQITLRMEADGVAVANMNHPIYFCPMCGERVRLEEARR